MADMDPKYLRRKFDDLVVVLSMLGTSTLPQTQKHKIKNIESKLQQRWRHILDELSWLGDYKTHGKTVVSIAAQHIKGKYTEGRYTKPHYVFWLASNHPELGPIQRHLEFVLGELGKVANNDQEQADLVRAEMFRASVRFSWARVENYARSLGLFVERLNDLSTQGGPKIDSALKQYLQRLVGLKDDHQELCYTAYGFRHSRFSKLLLSYKENAQNCSVWSAIRHYIGRLGSWWKACEILVSVAEQSPGFFSSVKIEKVNQKPSPLSASAQEELSCADVFSRLCGYYTGRFQQLCTTLYNSWDDAHKAEFESRLGRRKNEPYVHAEIQMLHHFHRQRLTFANGVAYIGCSKPSCYCCALYMHYHPQNVLRRPYHGNVWVKWILPSCNETFSKHEESIVKKMVGQMRSDFSSGVFRMQTSRGFESTTGISPTQPAGTNRVHNQTH